MIKLFRNIRKQLIEKGNIQKYLLYAIGEIFLVVIGILIALQINNWNNQKLLNRTELRIYENIKNQVIEDAELLEGVIEYNTFYYEQYVYANTIVEQNDRNKIDSLFKIVPNILRYSDFNKSGNIYQNLINSGDLKLLKNEEIIERIQRLEELYIYVNRLEENHYQVILGYGAKGIIDNLNFTTGHIERPDEIYSFQFQNLLYTFMDMSREKNDVYSRALNEIQMISKLIDLELNEES